MPTSVGKTYKILDSLVPLGQFRTLVLNEFIEDYSCFD
jgi:hypothetical protein